MILGRLFRKKKPLTDINEMAGFFAELISRSKNYLRIPVNVHFISDGVEGKPYRVSEMGDFLPFLRTVLFDAAQNTVPNPETSLRVHRATESSAGEIASAIAREIRREGGEFFIITWGTAGMRRDIVEAFCGIGERDRKRITLFHLPLGTGDTRAETGVLAAAVRILLKGERIAAGEAGMRMLQGKI